MHFVFVYYSKPWELNFYSEPTPSTHPTQEAPTLDFMWTTSYPQPWQEAPTLDFMWPTSYSNPDKRHLLHLILCGQPRTPTLTRGTYTWFYVANLGTPTLTRGTYTWFYVANLVLQPWQEAPTLDFMWPTSYPNHDKRHLHLILCGQPRTPTMTRGTYTWFYVANLVPQPWQEAPTLDFMWPTSYSNPDKRHLHLILCGQPRTPTMTRGTYTWFYVANLVPQPWQEAPTLDFMWPTSYSNPDKRHLHLIFYVANLVLQPWQEAPTLDFMWPTSYSNPDKRHLHLILCGQPRTPTLTRGTYTWFYVANLVLQPWQEAPTLDFMWPTSYPNPDKEALHLILCGQPRTPTLTRGTYTWFYVVRGSPRHFPVLCVNNNALCM